MRPNAGGSTIRVDRRTFPAEGEISETLVLPDGQKFELALAYLPPDAQ